MGEGVFALGLAVMASGCTKPSLQDAGDDTSTSSDTSADTDSILEECSLVELSLSKPLDGNSIEAVMLPGPSKVTGSCGGGGADAAYLVTSNETSHYHLWVSADELGSATFHVHAGESCHGPELYCSTGPHSSFELLLEAGESVTVVVDVEPDLEIPEDGLRYQVGITWADPPDQPCQEDELFACHETHVEALASCFAITECGAFDELAMCIDELRSGVEGCDAQFCPDGPYHPPSDCEDVCDDRRSSCEQSGCDFNSCIYEWQMCMDGCDVCNLIDFEFAYAGTCELALPGPPGPSHAPFVGLAVGDEQLIVSEPGVACGDPEAYDAVWQTESVLLLCDSACDLFALSGTAEVRYGAPPCE